MKFYLNIWFSLNVYYGQARFEYNCPNRRIASAIYSKCVDILCRVRFLDLVRFAQQLRKFWGFSVSEKNALAAKLHIRSHTFKEVLKLTLDLFYYFLMAVYTQQRLFVHRCSTSSLRASDANMKCWFL